MIFKLKVLTVRSLLSKGGQGGIVGAGAGILLGLASVVPAMALPPPEDTPEEILRTEVILSGRSPVDGKPLTAAQYVEIQARLQSSTPPKLNPVVRDRIFQLRLLRTLRSFFPFLPI